MKELFYTEDVLSTVQLDKDAEQRFLVAMETLEKEMLTVWAQRWRMNAASPAEAQVFRREYTVKAFSIATTFGITQHPTPHFISSAITPRISHTLKGNPQMSQVMSSESHGKQQGQQGKPTQASTMRACTLAEMVSIAIQTRTPAILWGPPGIGKTSITNAIAKQLQIHCETVISSLRDPTDIGGLPYIHEGIVHLAAPDWARRLCAIGEDKVTNKLTSVLFFDEITCTPPAVQAALLRVILEGVVGDTQLPASVAKIAAANPPDQAAGGWDLAPPLMNRFMHIDCELDPLAWADGFTNGFPMHDQLAMLPTDWEDAIPHVRMQIGQFIKNTPNVLLSIPKDQKSRAFPTPRSWDMLSRVLAATDILNVDPGKFAAGIIGTGAGLQFISFRQTRQFNLDVVSTMAGNNDYVAKLSSAPVEAIASFTSALVTNIVTSNISTDKLIRGWHVLFNIWKVRGKKLDMVYNSAAKLVTATPLKPREAFKAVSGSLEEQFVNDVNQMLATHLGINIA